jgi:hypothetical protein
MNKQEALNKIEELKKFVEDCDKEEDIIYVPENIKFEDDTGEGDCMGLVFDTDRVLYTEDNKLVVVHCNSVDILPHKSLKLVKVDQPEAGKWYFVTDYEIPDFSRKDFYHKYVSESEYFYVSSNGSINKSKSSWNVYYQVVRVNEE